MNWTANFGRACLFSVLLTTAQLSISGCTGMQQGTVNQEAVSETTEAQLPDATLPTDLTADLNINTEAKASPQIVSTRRRKLFLFCPVIAPIARNQHGFDAGCVFDALINRLRETRAPVWAVAQ